MRIVPRSEWGAAAPTNVTRVAPARRTAFVIHYDGNVPLTRTGPSVPRQIQRYHQRARGWADIGYNFVIDLDGNIFEGRGWDILGAHAGPPGNAPGIGVQCHIGGSQQPSPAMLAALRWLYAQACQRYGRTLTVKGHRDYMDTSCPGDHLYKIIQAGLAAAQRPAPTARVSAAVIAQAARRDPAAASGTSLSDAHRAQVTTVETALVSTGWLQARWADGHYGTTTTAAARGFQRKHSPGTTPDGILGPKELKRLFQLAGMSVEVTA